MLDLKSEGAEYYDYVMNYVDDIIFVSIDAVGKLEKIAQFTRINNGNIEPPSDLLRAVLVKKTVDGVNLWTIPSQKFVKNVLDNAVEVTRSKPYLVPFKALTPMVKCLDLRGMLLKSWTTTVFITTIS